MTTETEKIIEEFEKEMANFCNCIDFGKSFLNNQAIQFMNRGFDIEKSLSLQNQKLQKIKEELKEYSEKIRKDNTIWRINGDELLDLMMEKIDKIFKENE